MLEQHCHLANKCEDIVNLQGWRHRHVHSLLALPSSIIIIINVLKLFFNMRLNDVILHYLAHKKTIGKLVMEKLSLYQHVQSIHASQHFSYFLDFWNSDVPSTKV